MRTIILAAAVTLALGAPAQAITANDYVNNLSPEERSAYLFGALEMAMSMYANAGRQDKADCARSWFTNETNEANTALWQAMGSPAVQEYPAAVAVRFVIEKKCGE